MQLAVFILLSIHGNSLADFIVDTGAYNDTGGYSLYNHETEGGYKQWLAAGFEVSSNTTITSIEMFLGGGVGTATAAIYTNNESIPGTELFSNVFTTTDEEDWDGIYSQSWSLDPGTYWAVFEIRSGQTYDGFSRLPLSFLELYAFYDDVYENSWINIPSTSGLGFSIRIQDDNISPVPVPSSITLLSFGFLGLLSVATRNNSGRAHFIRQ